MKTPLELRFLGLDTSPALEKATHERAAGLEHFCRDIVSCRVTIERLNDKHRPHGRSFAVRIEVTIPGHALHVDRVQHEDPYVALRDAFDDMQRQIEDTVRRVRGYTKAHVQPRPATPEPASSTPES